MTGNFHTRGDTPSSGSASSKRLYTGNHSTNGVRAKGSTVETGSRNGLRKQQPPLVSNTVEKKVYLLFGRNSNWETKKYSSLGL